MRIHASIHYPIYLCLVTTLLLAGRAGGQDLFFSLEIVNPNPVGSGARAMGQGNAFIAVADDATAASWNPAGLSQLEKPEFSIAFEGTSNILDTSSTLHPESNDEDSFQLKDLNYASVVLPFYWYTNMVFSLSYFKLFRFDKEMDFPINQELVDSSGGIIVRNLNYDFDQYGSFSVVAPAFGINLDKRLSIGITFNLWNDELTGDSRFKKTEQTTGKRIFGGQEFDVNFSQTNEIEIDEGYSLIIGGLYRIDKFLALGLVIKPSFDLELDQRVESNNTPVTLDATLKMPFIVGAGLSLRPNKQSTISLDATWTKWSTYEFKQKGKLNPITGKPLDEDPLNDTITLRIGAEYLIIRDTYIFPFRWGIGYDPAPATKNVDDYYTINVGTGIQVGNRVNFDIAYEFRWGNNVNGDSLQIIDATQDIHQHRMLGSLIVYF